MKNQTLRNKILGIFDIFMPDSASNADVIADLDRRGKLSNKKMIEVIFLLIEEIENLETSKQK